MQQCWLGTDWICNPGERASNVPLQQGRPITFSGLNYEQDLTTCSLTVWSFPTPQHWGGHSWSAGSTPEFPCTQVNKNTKVSWTQLHEDDQVFGAHNLHWEAEKLALSILVKIFRGILFIYTNNWWMWKLRIWSQALSLEEGQVAISHYWNRKLHVNLRYRKSLWEYSNTGAGFPEQLCSLHPWRYSVAGWTRPWAASIWWPSSEQEGLDQTISRGPL